MDLAMVMDDMAEACKAVGVRSYPFYATSIDAPAVVVGWPEIDYGVTFARGMCQYTIKAFVMSGALENKSARNRMAEFLKGTGPKSIRAALETYPYRSNEGSAHDVTVDSATVEMISVGAVEYLAGVFTCTVTGSDQ